MILIELNCNQDLVKTFKKYLPSLRISLNIGKRWKKCNITFSLPRVYSIYKTRKDEAKMFSTESYRLTIV